jgi:hypothetical protein
MKTRWNGEKCKARRVLIRVGACPLPTWWYAGLVGTEMKAVEVVYGGQTFYLADEDGNGWHKVTVEHGGPHWGHNSVDCAEVIKERTDEDLGKHDCRCASA